MRISNNQTYRSMIERISVHREEIAKYSDEISTGLKVSEPGDSRQAGTVERFRQLLNRIAGHEERIAPAKALLTLQDGILKQANDLIVRAKEIAQQATNETVSAENRRQMAEEIYQLRDHLAALANTTFQGRYIYAGAADNDVAYDKVEPFYTPPGSGNASIHYAYTTRDGAALKRSISASDDESSTVDLTTPGNQIFDEAINALERLGRSLAGYTTDPAAGAPNGGGTAYTFPDDFHEQTEAIRGTIALLDTAREDDIMPEQVSVAGRLRRLETAESVLGLSKVAAQEALSQLQDADIPASATALTQAQTALQASLTITSKLLTQTLMDYI